jgi:hypothetical protein
MCFNANVSFGASVVIGAIGIVSLKRAKDQSQLGFAAIPLLFATQQFVEGVLWLALKEPDSELKRQIATHIFIVIAQVVWPIWVPLSILLMEREKKRKRILFTLLSIGILFSLFGAYRLLFYDLVAVIDDHHIKYIFNFSNQTLNYLSILYVLPTIFPPFFSSIKKMISLGSMLLISLIISKIFYDVYTISVWCFFAALISSFVLFIISNLNFTPIKKTAIS